MSRSMAFVEIGKGELAREVQQLFVRGQDASFQKGVKAQIKLTINVYPPDPKDPDRDMGYVSYDTNLLLPADKSIKYHTLLNDRGQIVQNGKNKNSILNLDFFESNEPEFNEIEENKES